MRGLIRLNTYLLLQYFFSIRKVISKNGNFDFKFCKMHPLSIKSIFSLFEL
jgi:hypothetical protein